MDIYGIDLYIYIYLVYNLYKYRFVSSIYSVYNLYIYG